MLWAMSGRALEVRCSEPSSEAKMLRLLVLMASVTKRATIHTTRKLGCLHKKKNQNSGRR